jgi:hypothetical protein
MMVASSSAHCSIVPKESLEVKKSHLWEKSDAKAVPSQAHFNLNIPTK